MSLKNLSGRIVLLSCFVVGLVWASSDWARHIIGIPCKFDVSLTNLKVGAVYWQRCNTNQDCPVDTQGNVSATFMQNVVINGLTYKHYVANITTPITCNCDGSGTYKICGDTIICAFAPCNNTNPKCGNQTKANYRWEFSNVNNIATDVYQYQNGYAVLPNVTVSYISECIQKTNNLGEPIPCGKMGCN